MSFLSKDRFEAMQTKLAASYNVKTVTEMFNVEVPKAVALINAVQQSIAFLQMVSIINVTDTKGDIVTLHAPTSIAGRTDTTAAGKERVAQVVGNKTARTYETVQTNFDIALRYSDVDAWRRFSDYDRRILAMIYRRIGLDQLLIGWYGKSCAKDTNRETNPLLQDVNFGWLYDLSTNKPENYIKADSGQKLQLGKGGDWNNLDQLAYELLTLIPEENRTGNEMVLVGRRIVAWESGKIFEVHGQTPSEKTKFALLSKTYGGLPAITPACFPDNGVMVTDPANLQIYIQEGSLRRQLIDNPKRDQIEHYQSQNECYRISDLDAAAAVNYEDIEFVSNSTTGSSDQGGGSEQGGGTGEQGA